MLEGNVLRVHVADVVANLREGVVGIFGARQVAVACVPIDGDPVRRHQLDDAQQACGGLRELSVRLDADEDAVARGDLLHAREGVAHGLVGERVVHPRRPQHLVGVDDVGLDEMGEHDRARQAVHGGLGLHQRAVARQARDPQAMRFADLAHELRVLLHRERVEVADLREEAPPRVDHRFYVGVPDLGGHLDAIAEVEVGAADELHVDGDAEVSHGPPVGAGRA